MSSNTKNIYDEYIRPLPREQQLLLLNLLQTELNGEENQPQRSIIELHGLGKEIWQGIDPKDYVTRLREEWDEPAR